MEFEQNLHTAQQERPWTRTCWPFYDHMDRTKLQVEYRKLAGELAVQHIDSLDIGTAKVLLETWGDVPTDEAAIDITMARKESQLNCLGLRLREHFLLVTDSIQWFT